MDSSRQPEAAELQPRKTHRRNYLLALAGCAALPLVAVVAIGGSDALAPAVLVVLALVDAVIILYVSRQVFG